MMRRNDDAKAMTFAEFSRINRDRAESPNGFNRKLSSWSLSDWMVATLGELGEAANVVKKLNRVRDGIPGNKETESELWEAIGYEIADAFISLDLLTQSLALDLGEIVQAKFDKTSAKIGYPVRLNAEPKTIEWIDAPANPSEGCERAEPVGLATPDELWMLWGTHAGNGGVCVGWVPSVADPRGLGELADTVGEDLAEVYLVFLCREAAQLGADHHRETYGIDSIPVRVFPPTLFRKED